MVIPTEPDIKLGQHLVKGRIVLMWWCESGTVSATFVLFCVYSPTRAGLNAARCIKPRPNDRNMPHNMSQHCWTQHVECVWPPCCDMLAVVGSSLKLVKFEPTTPNMSQQGGQTHATCCTQQCCVGMLRSFGRGLTRKTDGNFGNVAEGVLFSKVAYQRKRW